MPRPALSPILLLLLTLLFAVTWSNDTHRPAPSCCVVRYEAGAHTLSNRPIIASRADATR
ncbi:MAG: hypothetical protein R3B90_20460 [Planctomycetaceae bacterium]